MSDYLPPTAPESAAPPSPSVRAKRRNWMSFSLRTLLIIVPLAAIGLGVGFRWWYPQYLERRAVQEVERLGGKVARDERGNVITVELPGAGLDDSGLRRLVEQHLRYLPELHDLVLANNDISDDGLQALAELPQLKYVYLAQNNVTDQGVAELKAKRPNMDVRLTPPSIPATRLAARDIYHHAILSLAMAPDGRTIVAGNGEGRLVVWDLATEEIVRSAPVHEEWTFGVAFHPSGKLLATGGGDNLIKLWNWPELTEAGRFVGHDDDVHGIAFTPDGRTLVTTSDDWTVRIWDVASRKLRHVLDGHSATIPGLAISPDGRLAASASRDGTVRLWNIADGVLVSELKGHTDDVMSVAFHPNGKELATASYDRTVIRWNLRTRRPIQKLPGHKDWVFHVSYSPSGDELISAAGDGVRAWDLASGRPLWHSAEQKNVSSLAWIGGSSDSGLASSSADGSIRLWRSATGEQIAALWSPFGIPVSRPVPFAAKCCDAKPDGSTLPLALSCPK